MGWLGRIAVIGLGQAVVRETASAALSNVGWGPLIVAFLSTIGAAWGAWSEGKTALDITVYGLATFASVLFLGWISVQFVDALKGRPMTLAIRDRLTFGDIATR